MAHKKAAGSVKNLKDSQPKYRGVKVFGGQSVLAGNIIIRQKGSKYECGKNTYEAADFSILASTDGVVAFKKKNFKKFNGRTYLKTVVEVLSVDECARKSTKRASAGGEGKTTEKKTTVKKVAEKKEEKKVVSKKVPEKKTAKKEASTGGEKVKAKKTMVKESKVEGKESKKAE